jgi:anaerobic magnesium-protoporphyrin IX monomethyl ester cyclase
MSRFTIINPNDAACYTFSRARTRRLPLGQAYIAKALQFAGHDVSVLDASAVEYTEDQIVEKVVESKPDFVGIGGTTPLYTQIASLSKKIKKALPNTTVILGGPHVSSLPIPSLNTSAADFICIGEAEESVVAVVDAVNKGTDVSNIPGIAFRGVKGPEVTNNVSYYDWVRIWKKPPKRLI